MTDHYTAYLKTFQYLSRDIAGEKIRLRLGENSRLWEYDKYVHVVDVRGIKDWCSGSNNDLILSNFFGYLIRLILKYASIEMFDVAGNSYGIATGDPVYAAAILVRGTSSIPPTFTDNSVTNRAVLSSTVVIGQLADRNRISVYAALGSYAYEVGIEQVLIDTAGSNHSTLLTRSVGYFTPDQTVTYSIDLFSPWTYPMAMYLYGMFLNANVTNLDVTGAQFSHNTSGIPDVDGGYLVVSQDSISWSPYIYTIPNAISLTTYTNVTSVRVLRFFSMAGVYAPTSDISINTIGIFKTMRTATGTSAVTCILAESLSQPVTFYGGRINTVIIRFAAF